jgi:hypothetical protein
VPPDPAAASSLHRPLLAFTLAATGILAALNLLNLAGGAYAAYAAAHLGTPRADDALNAARISVSLAPWSSARSAQLGWVLAERGDGEASAAAYADALRWAPADPLLWNEFALAQGRARRFGPAFGLAVATSNRLAPTSPAIQASNAAMALSYWRDGSPDVRREWRQSVRYELDNNRPAFQRQLLAMGYWVPFCAYVAADVGEQAWCDEFARERRQCAENPQAVTDSSVCDYVE